ncbi:OmpA family protein [Sabulibacter ruber]|uniref:OmpA family protein n=1 Tax=Sabulibacter ruber TaxID=2811901 RepID=UPI001A96EAE9
MKIIYLLLVVCLTYCFQPAALQAQANQTKADKHYSNFDYALALEEYLKLLDKGQPTLHITERIAHCYRLINQPGAAEFWYRQTLLFPTSAPGNLYYFANACRQNGKYQEAKQAYQLFAQRDPSRRTEAQQLVQACDMAMSWINRPLPVDVTVDSTLSSKFSDFSPTFYKENLVFSSDRGQTSKSKKVYGWTGAPFLQLYQAQRQSNNTWGDIKPLEKSINTQFHNATATFSPSFEEIFFTRTKRVKKRVLPQELAEEFNWQRYSKTEDFIDRLEIYTAVQEKGKWKEVKLFPHSKGESYSVGHPALSPDGTILYFASDMPGGYGQTDIYYSVRQGPGDWSVPINAGPTINTPGKEVFPVVQPDGRLFFSSDGHLGMGGLDIFSATGNGDAWVEVKNLYYPYNSPRDDFGLIFEKDSKNGFLSSNRGGDGNSDDIYRVGPSTTPCQLAGATFARVPTRTKGRFVKVPVEAVNLDVTTNGDPNSTFRIISNEDGQFLFIAKANQTYTIKGSKKGYLTKTIQVAPDCRKVTDTVHIEMVLDRNIQDQAIVLENIYYDLDKHDLRPEAKEELNKVVDMLRDNPEIRIELSSHTDSRQTYRYNQMLSQLRASTAVLYILSKGVDSKRVVAKGYGETRLLNRCKDGVPCSEEDHQLNRRTEFKIIK